MSSKKRATCTRKRTTINIDPNIHKAGITLARQDKRSFSRYLELLIENAAQQQKAA